MKENLGKAGGRGTLALLCVGIALLVCAVTFSLQLWPGSDYEKIEWELTLIGSAGQQIVLSYEELLMLPPVETSGGFFTSVGAIHGPFQIRGVSIDTLCDLVGGMAESEIMFVAARDGYSAVYDYQQLNGRVDTFEPGTVRHVPGGSTIFVLIYEQDGRRLIHDHGGPLRLAVASPDGLLTEGHWWVKWVNRIEIREPRPAAPG